MVGTVLQVTEKLIEIVADANVNGHLSEGLFIL